MKLHGVIIGNIHKLITYLVSMQIFPKSISDTVSSGGLDTTMSDVKLCKWNAYGNSRFWI